MTAQLGESCADRKQQGESHMRYLMLLLASFTFVTTSAPADARGNWTARSYAYGGRVLRVMPRNPGMPGMGTLFYYGARGYSQSGWEIGRMQSMRRYGTDPGPWPGWRGALGR